MWRCAHDCASRRSSLRSLRPARAARRCSRVLPASRQRGGYDPDGLQSQKRAWLFMSYLACFGALGGAIASLITYFINPPHDIWVGSALVIQCVAILAGGLLYWLSRSVSYGGAY